MKIVAIFLIREAKLVKLPVLLHLACLSTWLKIVVTNIGCHVPSANVSFLIYLSGPEAIARMQVSPLALEIVLGYVTCVTCLFVGVFTPKTLL